MVAGILWGSVVANINILIPFRGIFLYIKLINKYYKIYDINV